MCERLNWIDQLLITQIRASAVGNVPDWTGVGGSFDHRQRRTRTPLKGILPGNLKMHLIPILLLPHTASVKITALSSQPAVCKSTSPVWLTSSTVGACGNAPPPVHSASRVPRWCSDTTICGGTIRQSWEAVVLKCGLAALKPLKRHPNPKLFIYSASQH